MALLLVDTPLHKVALGWRGKLRHGTDQPGLPDTAASSVPNCPRNCSDLLSATASIRGAGWCRCRIQPRDSGGKAPQSPAFPLSLHAALSKHPPSTHPKTECTEQESHSPVPARDRVLCRAGEIITSG